MGNAWRAFKDEKLPKNYFRIEVLLLRGLGLELLNQETLLYSICSKLFLFFLVIVFTGVELYEIYAQWGDLNTIVAVALYLITHITGGIKTTLLFFNRKKIGEILKNLHKPPFKPSEFRGGNEEARQIRQVIKKTEIQLVVYFLVVLGTICSGIINTFVTRFTKDPEHWLFPYAPTISIMDLSKSPLFEIASLYQFFGVFTYAGIIATTYVLLSTIMAHISIQLKILGNAFRNLKPRAEKMLEASGDASAGIDHFLKIALKESVQHHISSLDLAQEMENLCSLMILVVFFASVILMCFLLYFASLFPLISMVFFQNACYWLIIVCQIGMYCYWGNEVSLEAENVAKAVAEADWVDAKGEVSKPVVLVIARAQRPLNITAGKFVPLSMTTFMSMVKGSFSYFMVLRQTQETEC